MSRVAIITGRLLESKHQEPYDAFSQSLIQFVQSLGYIPVPISNQLVDNDSIQEFLRILNPQLIMLAGGEDLGANPARDVTEGILLNYAKENSLVKVFGICRGMQFIVSFLGGSLEKCEGHVSTIHSIYNQGLYLGEVNSFHTFKVSQLPYEMLPTSQAADGSIESCAHRTLPWIAWMWHPERMEMPSWMGHKLSEELQL